MEKLSMDVIKEEVQLLDPDLEVNEFGFQVAVVLISAALVTGPNTESLIAFTGYPAHLVAEISDRMHKAELWRNGTVESDHWFDGAKWTVGIWIDRLVAEGGLLAQRREDGEWVYRVPEKRELQ